VTGAPAILSDISEPAVLIRENMPSVLFLLPELCGAGQPGALRLLQRNALHESLRELLLLLAAWSERIQKKHTFFRQ
jgi:hypothetical protein